MTVPNIWRGSPLFYYVYAKICKPFSRKSLFNNIFNLNRMFLKLFFQYLIYLCEKVQSIEIGVATYYFDVLRLMRK